MNPCQDCKYNKPGIECPEGCIHKAQSPQPPQPQQGKEFPECANECEAVKLLGVGECDSVCPQKFKLKDCCKQAQLDVLRKIKLMLESGYDWGDSAYSLTKHLHREISKLKQEG